MSETLKGCDHIINKNHTITKRFEFGLVLVKSIGPDNTNRRTFFKCRDNMNCRILKIAIETVISIIRLGKGKKHPASLNFARVDSK